MKSFFNEKELSDLKDNNEVEFNKKVKEIHQVFNNRRIVYNQLKTSSVFNMEDWKKINELLIEFDKKYNQYNIDFSNLSKGMNDTLNSYINLFGGIISEFNIIESELHNIRIKEQNHSIEIESVKEQVLIELKSELSFLKDEVKTHVSKGIQDLTNLKNEYNITSVFSEKIQKEKDDSNENKKLYLKLFIGCILLIPIFILITFYIETFLQSTPIFQYTVRGIISLSLAFLSIFLFNQYRLYQMINLKYSHLNNFIGGGAAFVSELIGLEDENKKELNKKLANMFIEIDDLMNGIKSNKHPYENFTKMMDSVTKNTIAILKEKK